MNRDYTQGDLLFKIQKFVRYISLYGWSKTLAKVKGQYHAKATADFDGPRWMNPACKDPEAASRVVAIIGCGNFAFSNIAYYLAKRDSRFLRATYDTPNSRALSLCKSFGGSYATAELTDILHDPMVKIVFIASNHASHAEYAVACIRGGKECPYRKAPCCKRRATRSAPYCDGAIPPDESVPRLQSTQKPTVQRASGNVGARVRPFDDQLVYRWP